MHLLRFFLPALFVSFGASVGGAAWPDDTARSGDTPTPREIYVRATRIAGETIDPARTVTILEEKDFRAKNPATVADILRDVPGIETVRQGGVGQTTSIFIRGARSEDTLILIDGIEVNDAMAPAAGFDFATLPATGIARIEVYRGPQSVRFGAGALGGVINIVTEEGESPARVRLSGEAGGFDTRRGSAHASGRAGTLGYSLGVESFASEGFSAAAAEDGNREPDGATLRSVTGKLAWRPSPTTAIVGTTRALDGHVDLDLHGGGGGDDPNSASRARSRVIGVRGSTRFFEERLKSSAGVSVAKIDRFDFNDPDAGNAQDFRESFHAEMRKIETEQEFLLREAHALRATFQHREESGFAESFGERRQSFTGTSGTYLYDDGEWFADLGGAVGIVASHRLSLGRRLEGGDTQVFLTHGSGFKPPSLFQRYSAYGTPGLTPETSTTMELSLERRFSPGFMAGLVFFRSEFRELIDFDFLANRYFNLSRARSEGAEARATIAFSTETSLELTSSYLDARDETTGAALPRRPRWSGTASLKYQSSALSAAISSRLRGARPDIDPNTFARTEATGYEVVDAHLSYPVAPAWKVHGRVENLFDRRYQEVAGYGSASRAFFVGAAVEL